MKNIHKLYVLLIIATYIALIVDTFIYLLTLGNKYVYNKTQERSQIYLNRILPCLLITKYVSIMYCTKAVVAQW